MEWVWLYFEQPSPLCGIILGYSWVALCLWQCVQSYRRGMIWLMIIWLFMLMYCFEPIKYFQFGDKISYRSQSRNDFTVYAVALYGYLFNLVFAMAVTYKTRKITLARQTRPVNAPFYLWAPCLAVAVVFMIFGKTGETILETGGYGQGGAEKSSMFGYAVIPFTVALIYSGTPKRRMTTFVLAALFVLKDLLYGGRVDSVILCLCFYVVYFQYKIKPKQMLYLLFAAIVLNQTFEMVRGDIYGRSIDEALLSSASGFSLSSGNTQEVYYASMRVYYMIQTGFLDAADRAESFVSFLASSVMPYSKLPEIANLSAYAKGRFNTGGGGLISAFLYAWGGIPLIIASAWLLATAFVRFMRGSKGSYLPMYITFAIATVPRWYAYYPIQLIKFCVIGMLFYILMETIRTGRLPKPHIFN